MEGNNRRDFLKRGLFVSLIAPFLPKWLKAERAEAPGGEGREATQAPGVETGEKPFPEFYRVMTPWKTTGDPDVDDYLSELSLFPLTNTTGCRLTGFPVVKTKYPTAQELLATQEKPDIFEEPKENKPCLDSEQLRWS